MPDALISQGKLEGIKYGELKWSEEEKAWLGKEGKSNGTKHARIPYVTNS